MDYADSKLVSLSSGQAGWHAVYVDDAGEPLFEPIACWAVYSDSTGERLVAMARSPSGDASLEPADLDPTFVGLAAPGETDSTWKEPCAERFEALRYPTCTPEPEGDAAFDTFDAE